MNNNVFREANFFTKIYISMCICINMCLYQTQWCVYSLYRRHPVLQSTNLSQSTSTFIRFIRFKRQSFWIKVWWMYTTDRLCMRNAYTVFPAQIHLFIMQWAEISFSVCCASSSHQQTILNSDERLEYHNFTQMNLFACILCLLQVRVLLGFSWMHTRYVSFWSGDGIIQCRLLWMEKNLIS